jgi:hypothetical protein
MLNYFLDNTNSYTIRTYDTASNVYTMSMQDMITQTNTTMSLVSASFTTYENLFAFTGSISGAYVGQEFRLELYSSGSTEPIWYGSLQVYQSQSVDKAVYKTQNDQYISHESTNEYIIMN